MNTEILPSDSQIKDRARARVRDVLGGSALYQSMSLPDQRSIYLSMVDEEMDKERSRLGIARSMATDSGKEMGYKGYDPGLSGDTKAFTELVRTTTRSRSSPR
jgi:hypothetical protein